MFLLSLPSTSDQATDVQFVTVNYFSVSFYLKLNILQAEQ